MQSVHTNFHFYLWIMESNILELLNLSHFQIPQFQMILLWEKKRIYAELKQDKQYVFMHEYVLSLFKMA